MKNNFRGWTSVYSFTFRQTTKGVGFKLVTAMVSLLLIVTFVLINFKVAKPDKDKDLEATQIKTVYVLDNSGLQPTNYKEIISQLGAKEFQHVEFTAKKSQPIEEVIKTAKANSSETIAVVISASESGYEMKAFIPEGSKISKGETEALLGPMASAFESNKLTQAGLSPEQLTALLKPAVESFAEVGKSTNMTVKIIKIVAPMTFSFMLYLMFMLYGQNISKSVSTEKTSKLMEVLLTSVHPYALITGKVLALTTMALIQFVTWIASVFAGLYGGNAIVHRIYPQYENPVITIINFLKVNIGETALTMPAVILAIIFFCVGFLFYCVISAAAGSMVSKPEDTASTQAIFQFPIITSWLISYFAPVTGKAGLLTALRNIPFTSPFLVPVDLLTGTIGFLQGIISLVLLLFFSLLTIILSGRIYKGLVLYNGQELSLKLIGNVLKSSK